MEAGQQDLADQIVLQQNYSTINKMTFSELEDWAEQSGLTKAELQFIQPGYPSEFSVHLQILTAFTWLIGMVTLLVNLRHLRNENQERLIPRITLFFSLFVMFFACGLLTLWQSNLSYKNTIDVPEMIIERALTDAPPFLHAGLSTFMLAIIAVVVAFCALGRSHPDARKRKSKKLFQQAYRINKHNHQRGDK